MRPSVMRPTVVSNAIRQGRASLGLSRLQLAEAMSRYEPTSIYALVTWEEGERAPSDPHMAALAKVLGWSHDYYREMIVSAHHLRVEATRARRKRAAASPDGAS